MTTTCTLASFAIIEVCAYACMYSCCRYVAPANNTVIATCHMFVFGVTLNQASKRAKYPSASHTIAATTQYVLILLCVVASTDCCYTIDVIVAGLPRVTAQHQGQNKVVQTSKACVI